MYCIKITPRETGNGEEKEQVEWRREGERVEKESEQVKCGKS